MVDYGDHYEWVRERKGYGLANLTEHLGGDEEDGARLQRNFHEREDVEMDIATLKVYEMFHLVDFLTQTIFHPISERIGHPGLPRTRDLIARRRLHWVSEVLAERVQEYIADPTIDSGSEFVSSIRESIQKWRFVSMSALFDRLNSDLRKALLGELTEELLYQARSHLPNPLDERIWSCLAIDLTKKVVHSLAKYLFCHSGQNEIRKQHLGEDLLKHAMDAAESVQNGSKAINNRSPAMDEYVNSLSFKSVQRKINEDIFLDESKEGMISLYDTKKIIHFGTAAAMADIQAYYDAVELCGIESYYIPGKTRRLSEDNRSIVAQYETDTINDSEKRSPQFYWMSRRIDAFKKGYARVNEKWYLENQVLTVVHMLASTCVDWSHSDGEHAGYNLETLCRKINIDLNDAKRALSQGAVNPTWPEPDVKTAYSPALSDVGPTNGPIRGRQKARHRTPSDAPAALSAAVVYEGTDPEFPGWTIQHRQRLNSPRLDYYWSHPELQGVIVRSKVRLKLLVSYANTRGVSLRVAYEIYRK